MISPGQKKASSTVFSRVHMENPFQKIQNDFDAGC